MRGGGPNLLISPNLKCDCSLTSSLTTMSPIFGPKWPKSHKKPWDWKCKPWLGCLVADGPDPEPGEEDWLETNKIVKDGPAAQAIFELRLFVAPRSIALGRLPKSSARTRPFPPRGTTTTIAKWRHNLNVPDPPHPLCEPDPPPIHYVYRTPPIHYAYRTPPSRTRTGSGTRTGGGPVRSY